jgi:hypothetical protein
MKTAKLPLIALLLFIPCAAQASNKVSSPDVKKGQVELEYRGGFDYDDTVSKNRAQVNKFIANYGITDRWRMEVKGNYTGRAGNLDWTYAEWSNRYQIFKDKEGWAKLSVQENYKFALQDALPDKLELTVLAAKDTGPLTHIANLNFENELGKRARGGTDVNLGWKTKYRLDPAFEPGVETYLDFGKTGSTNRRSPDKYQWGPVVSGKLPGGVKYDVGYLFGMNNAVPHGRLKYILTYGF